MRDMFRAKRAVRQNQRTASTPRTRHSWRVFSWTGILSVSLLSGLAISMTSGQGEVWGAQAGAKNKSKTDAKATKALRPTPGAGSKVDHAKLASIIDQEVAQRLKEESVQASPLADDAEFLRRAYLDLTGVIPPVEKVKEFLDSKDPNRRSKLIDELLASPRYGQFMAETWANAMVPRDSNNRRLLQKPLQDWLADKFNANTPWDKFVYDLLTASGPQDQNGAVTYFISNPTPDKVTDSVTKLFLGVQLQCAQCHNHPFTSWKQKEYWGMAAFFMKVRTSANPQQAAKKGVAIEVTEGPAAKGKKKGLPESAMLVPAKFLQGAEPSMGKSDPYRPVLAKWLTEGKNAFFAKAMVNKMWAHFFGRGIVNPIDDMHEGNVPSHAELLSALAEQFIANGFDVKYLARAITNSKVYQTSSRPHKGNEADTELFSHVAVRVMTPEQLYDSLTTVVGQGGGGGGKKAGPVGKKGPGTPREAFIAFFRIDDADPLEYQSGIPQALRLMNSPQFNNGNAAIIDQAVKAGGTPQAIEHLYLVTVSRRPTAQELDRLSKYVAAQSAPRTAFADILWALVNSSEFTANH